MKTITMVDLRTHSERVVQDLARGIRMTLSYRGKPLAELVPVAPTDSLSPLEALNAAQKASASNKTGQSIATYLKQLRQDQKAWSKRS